MAKLMDRFIYLGTEINAKKTDGEVNRRIQNSSDICSIMIGTLWYRGIQKQCKRTISKVYFKLIAIYMYVCVSVYILYRVGGTR
jgi:hypothetical protein